MDYPQIFDMAASPEKRRTEQNAMLADKRRDEPGLYGPLTIDEWRGLPLDYSVLDLCLDWPVDRPPYRPGRPVPQTGDFATVPTLILSGEFDTTTPPEDADLAAAAFPKARHLLLVNSFHVDALEDDADCAAPIVRRFVVDRDPGDVSCAAAIPPLREVADFARRTQDVAPAIAVGGNAASRRALSAAAAATNTAADVISRSWRNSSGRGLGLRGGAFTVERADNRIHGALDGVRWTEDLSVSGDIDWDRRTGDVHADLTLAGAEQGKVSVRWNMKAAAPRAGSDGTIGGWPVHAWMPAP
jgi:hypothetical protein